MRLTCKYKLEVIEYEYLYEDKNKLLSLLDKRYSEYSIKRSGPKLITEATCHETLHHMIIHVRTN